MPTYEYECANCGIHLEVLQSFNDKPLTDCSECGGKLGKVFHPAGVIFKGSGWYVTDSREGTEKSKYKEDGKPPEKPQDSKPVKTDNASKKTPDPAKSNSSDTPASSSPSNGDS